MRVLSAGAQRPLAGEKVCGDAFTVASHAEGTIVCLADGLGHGPAAYAAAEAACRHVRENAGAPLDALMRGIDRALSGLRGAAVSLLAIDQAAARVRFVGVGNVELRAVARTPIAPPNLPGIVGQRMRTPRIWEYPLAEGDLLVLVSDGISSRFELRPPGPPRAEGARRGNPRVARQVARRRLLRRRARRGGGGVSAPPPGGDPPPLPREVLEVGSPHDRLWASRVARRFAATLGFGPKEQARVALSVAELASNAAKYAGRGRVELRALGAPRPGCLVRVEDEGPGIAAPAEALCDGFSEGRFLTPDVPLAERRGLGVGLGSVCRMMDEVRLSPGARGGLVVEAVLWHPARSGFGEEMGRWRRA